MMNLLPGSYEGIGWVVVALASLCVAINQIDDFFERRKSKPGFPPAEQLDSSQRELAQRVEKLEAALAEIRREMKADREELTRAGSVRAAGIYKKIDEVRAELAASQRSLPNEIVALLKNTNVI